MLPKVLDWYKNFFFFFRYLLNKIKNFLEKASKNFDMKKCIIIILIDKLIVQCYIQDLFGMESFFAPI